MKRTTLWLILTVFASVVCFGSLIYYSFNRITPGKIPEISYEGKRVWERYSCVQCHPILGNGGYSAPDLTNVVTVRNTDWLENFFDNPPILKPGKSKKHLGLSYTESRKVIEYLKYIESIKKYNWPPPSLKDMERLKQKNEKSSKEL